MLRCSLVIALAAATPTPNPTPPNCPTPYPTNPAPTVSLAPTATPAAGGDTYRRRLGGGGASGTAKVNDLILTYANAGLDALATDDCTTASAQLDLIKVQMNIPLIQGMLRYAYKADPSGGGGGSKEIAEGWAFAFAILPQLNNCDFMVAATVVSNMQTTASSPMADGYETVKTAVESTYSCLGISCADIGGLVDSYDASGTPTAYIWEACTDADSTSGSVAKQGLAVSAAIVSALGAMLMAF